MDELEKVGGNAILISHIPPGDDCVHAWGERFRALQDRYQNVIKFGLFGHTHTEYFGIVKSLQDNKNVGLHFICGSLTSMTNYNPSFTLLEIDEETMALHNIKTYYFNLTEANKPGSAPKWEILHDYLDHYQMIDLSPDSFGLLADRVLEDEQFAIDFVWNKVRRGQPRMQSCGEECRKDLYCDLTTTEEWQRNACNGKEGMDFAADPLNAIMNMVVSPWFKKTD